MVEALVPLIIYFSSLPEELPLQENIKCEFLISLLQLLILSRLKGKWLQRFWSPSAICPCKLSGYLPFFFLEKLTVEVALYLY